jgi:D-alanyl-D-alanine carboxypeptidase
MEGLAAIGSRIAEINAQLSRLAAPAPASSSSSSWSAASASSASSARSTASTAGAATAATAVATGATSFDDALATALTAASTPGGAAKTGTTQTIRTNHPSTSVAAPAAASGQLTSSGVPVELAKYGNGRVPASALESIGGGHRLWAPAAEAFHRLKAAAHRAGVSIGVTDSYRSYAEQVDVARRKGLHSQGGLAAKPGTSEHGWGKSLDLDLNASALRWMRGHASDFGFSENVSREPWHWTYAAR